MPYKRTSRPDIFSPNVKFITFIYNTACTTRNKLHLYVEAYKLNFYVHIEHERVTPHTAIVFEFTWQHNSFKIEFLFLFVCSVAFQRFSLSLSLSLRQASW